MPRIPENRLEAGGRCEGPFLRLRPDQIQRGIGVGHRVDRLNWRIASAIMATIAPHRLLFLQSRSIGEHRDEQVCRWRCCPDRAGKAARNKSWEQAAVIKMGMGEDDRINGLGIEWGGRVVQRFKRARTLEKAAIHQNACVAALYLIA